MPAPGTLYLIPTPIGNLGDITFRAVNTLKTVDVIACEDTRTSSVVLNEYGITTKRISLHLNNEHKKTPRVVERLNAGESVALITDAGTPGISDPGYLLVRACIEAGIRVEAQPGATAVIPALVASGLPSDRFVFEGFLPSKKGRIKRIQGLRNEERTVVLFESPHRIKKLIEQLHTELGGERRAVVVREISKKFETYHRGSLAELLEWVESTEQVKGEIVLVIAGKKHSHRLSGAD